ncbi:MAG TPA: hypothetical protein VHC90_20015 [Bryobacteraceae bacterium]|nr:hypothetical protein [Bryobacteraceae bacterium]
MRTVITRVFPAALLALALTVTATAQVQPNEPFHDQTVGASIQYDQGSSTPLTGSVFYAKLTDPTHGIFSYTRINETAVNLEPQFSVQTQTETGFCIFTTKFGTFDVFSCGSGGLATAGGSTGASGTGTVLVTKAIGKGWSVGVAGGPSYSGATGKVSYPVGLLFAWGK